MPSKNLSTHTYRKLVESIRRQIARAKDIIEQQTVVTYWSLGRSMHEFLKRHAEQNRVPVHCSRGVCPKI